MQRPATLLAMASLVGLGLSGVVAEAVSVNPLQEPGCREPVFTAPFLTAPCGGSTGPAAAESGLCLGGACVEAWPESSSLYLFSGEFHLEATDLQIRGRGLDVVWTRKYRSRIGPDVGHGNGWDFGYNIKIRAIDVGPGEAKELRFQSKEVLTWEPPDNPGGPPEAVAYCTQRSAQPDGFANPGITTFVDIDNPVPMTVDPLVPPVGEAFFYLVSAKNGFREGPLGARSDGTLREGFACGISGPDLILHDGNTRQDLYPLQPSGTWTTDEFFREFTREIDGSYILTFADSGFWKFHPFDGSPWEGKIQRIVDRNGNTIVLEYDAQGRLVTIHDTLDTAAHERDIVIGHDANGFVATVTDFTGRIVTFEYYDGIEPGGSFGDLKSVTTPAVVGTPTGNDFPLGKTTTYTYSTGFADPRLNHNLLSITDPKGQTYLVNEYSGVLDPFEFEFDRLTRQVRGDPNDIINIVYTAQLPDPGNNFAVIKATINDRVGNVSERLFDASNRLVLDREYTGRAEDAQLPTDLDLLINPPVGPLRPDDPPFFETRYAWNGDSLATTRFDPNGDVLTFTYDDANPSQRSQGNLLQGCRSPGPLGGDQATICESLEYDPAVNFVIRRVDGLTNETLHSYDANGNLTRTVGRIPSIIDDYEYNSFGQLTKHTLPDNGSVHRRIDRFEYYAIGPQRGYLKDEIIDDGGFGLTTTYEYDILGRMTRQIDPRGHDETHDFNALDQIVQQTSREVTGGSGVRYVRKAFYDPNDNIVRIDIPNVDDEGLLQPNGDFTTTYEYDILNRVTRRCQETGSHTAPIPGPPELPDCDPLPFTEFIKIEYAYDPNRNQTLVRNGEATSGSQSTNVVRTLYDERDLIYHVIRGEGAPYQATDQSDYDSNGNLKRTLQGIEDTPRVTEYAYDGYDRLTRISDPMGNERTLSYDANGNNLSRRLGGELIDVVGDVGNVRLSEVTYAYDSIDRLTRTTQEFFDASQAPVGDGQSITSVEYSANSQVTRVVDDNNHARLTVYDTANRPLTVTDAKDNTVTTTYDANSNKISYTEVEKHDLGAPDEIFVTTYAYDNLDRLTRVSDPVGNLRDWAYDSRGNRTREEDAQRITPADPGNITRYEYDGINRLTRTTRLLSSDGTGSGAPLDSIVIRRAWDDSSRLIELEDDNLNTTTYVYDSINRLTRQTYSDTTERQYTLDVHDNRVTEIDPNGSQIFRVFDLLDRVTERNITPGIGVVGVTLETFAYDGHSRLVQATNQDSTVTRSYDSLSRVIEENLNGRSTQSQYDGVGNRMFMLYPSPRLLFMTYDELDRIETINDKDAGLLASYDYVGPERVARRLYGNLAELIVEYDGISNAPDDFGVKLPVQMTHNAFEGDIIDDRTTTWDRMYNKTREQDVRAGGPSLTTDYVYDSIYRLTRSTSTAVGLIDYELDGVGNRVSVTGGPAPGSYTQSSLMPEPADRQVNQYTTAPASSREYDRNGNLISTSGLPNVQIQYDYRNRMVQFTDLASGNSISALYDALDRRIATNVNGVITRFFYDGTHVSEETDLFETPLATYVYGNGIDDVLNMRRGGEDYYYHADSQGSTRAITDAFAQVIERYEYSDYGAPEVFDGFGTPIPFSQIENPYLFTGRRYDPASGLYYYRTRYLETLTGRFTSRDTIGVWTDEVNLGNGYTYVGNNPASRVDPDGRWGWLLKELAKKIIHRLLGKAAAGATEDDTVGGPKQGHCPCCHREVYADMIGCDCFYLSQGQKPPGTLPHPCKKGHVRPDTPPTYRPPVKLTPSPYARSSAPPGPAGPAGPTPPGGPNGPNASGGGNPLTPAGPKPPAGPIGPTPPVGPGTLSGGGFWVEESGGGRSWHPAGAGGRIPQ